MRALFWLFVTIVVLSFVGVGLGFWKLYDLTGVWFLVGLAVYIILVLALVVMVVKLLTDLDKFLKELKAKLEAFMDKWGSKLVKILKLLGIIK